MFRFVHNPIIVTLISILGISLLVNVTDVSAVTNYDDAIRSTNDLKVGVANTSTGIAACSLQDKTSTWSSYITNSGNQTQIDSFNEALQNGSWLVTQQYNQQDNPGYVRYEIIIAWQESGDLDLKFGPTLFDSLTWQTDPSYLMASPTGGETLRQLIVYYSGNPSIGQCGTTSLFVSGTTTVSTSLRKSPDQNGYPSGQVLLASSVQPVFPAFYEGANVPGSLDSDNDGLVAARELAQGTSDTNVDSDSDGLNDYIESQWYQDRDDIFCGITECAYPNPLKRDVYIEIDWFDDGTVAFKPNTTQIESVVNAFDNKEINLHIDSGQYGGGNELPVYIESLKFEVDINDTDFFNLKNGTDVYSASFAEDRRGIWRYMITGNQLDDGGLNTTSGAAYAGDDDMFIALGRVAGDHPASVDTAIAGTIMHELGHSLCLSNTAYSGQDTSCLSNLIDTAAPTDYSSVMNYNKQFTMVDYSEGINILDDHDDWSAIVIGMNDFMQYGEDPSEEQPRGAPAFDKTPQY